MKYLAQSSAQQLCVSYSDDLNPGANEVKILTHASGVNRADLLQLAGKYPSPPGESKVIGLEVSGTVMSAPDDSPFKVGESVMALLSGGGYAQQVCVDAGCVIKMPPNLSFIEGAAIPEAFITAYQALFAIGQLNQKLKTKPAKVLVHAGASGVGSAAIQLAKVVGAEVFTTAGSDQKLQQLSALGAQHLINYNENNFCQYITEATSDEGVDIVVDFIGGSYLNDNLGALALDGVLVNLAMLGGRFSDKFDFAKLLAKRIRIEGSTLRNRDYGYKAELISRFSEQFLQLFAAGTLKPVVDSQYRYQDVATAHRKMANNENVGKLVLHSFD